ncbi:hypothetical protein D9M71_453400 [compost metagenome]
MEWELSLLVLTLAPAAKGVRKSFNGAGFISSQPWWRCGQHFNHFLNRFHSVGRVKANTDFELGRSMQFSFICTRSLYTGGAGSLDISASLKSSTKVEPMAIGLLRCSNYLLNSVACSIY